MRALRSAMLLAVSGVVLVLSLAPPVQACSRNAPPHLSDISPGQPIPDYGEDSVVGVYEQEHIAGSPWFILVSSRTVSVVTRYWGTPPPKTGLELHGTELGIIGGNSCGNEAGHKGLIGYGWVTENNTDHLEWRRWLPYINTSESVDGFGFNNGPLTPDQEAELMVAFGEPTVLGISTGDRVGASFLAWRFHMAAAVLLGGSVLFILFRRRRARGMS